MTVTVFRHAGLPAEWLLLAALLAAYPLSGALPAAWAHEGALLETVQVLLLGGGCLYALAWYLRQRPARGALLALWSAPAWLLLAGRELSWGRVLFASPGLGRAGAGTFWLEPAMRPLAALLLGVLLIGAWRYRIDELVRGALTRRVPWLCLAVALGAAAGSTCAEGHMGCAPGLLGARAERFEELAEVLAYGALFLLQASILRSTLAAGPVADTAPSALLSKRFQKILALSTVANKQGER